MSQQAPMTVIATRTLRMVDTSGAARPILIQVHAPVQEEDGTVYVCRYKITGLTRTDIESSTAGVDAIQAMHLCIIAVATWLDVVVRDTENRIEWADGGVFNNLELPRDASSETTDRDNGRPYDESIDREIRTAITGIIEDPSAARESLRRLRRVAFRRGLVAQVIKCLEGELTVARAVEDTDGELKGLRALARQAPSAANLVALACELETRGRQEAARRELMRAALVVEHGSELESLVLCKLRSLSTKQE